MFFRNDYNWFVDSEIAKKLNKFPQKHLPGYGEDVITGELREYINKVCKKETRSFVIPTGTLANIIALSLITRPHEAIIAVKEAHILNHEAGAIEATGHKIISVKSQHGKLTPKAVMQALGEHTDHHMVRPAVMYISNATELGTVYTKEELDALYDLKLKHGLLLYIDGARLANAMVASNISLAYIAKIADAFTIGGTKNGLPFGDLLILTNNNFFEIFPYHVKRMGGLLAKQFVGSALFLVYLEDDYYLINAKKANDAAKELCKSLRDITPPEGNQIFIELVDLDAYELIKSFDLEFWSEQDNYITVRITTTPQTDQKEIKALSECLIHPLKRYKLEKRGKK